MEYNACVSCALIGHNFPTVLQAYISICLCNSQYAISAVWEIWKVDVCAGFFVRSETIVILVEYIRFVHTCMLMFLIIGILY